MTHDKYCETHTWPGGETPFCGCVLRARIAELEQQLNRSATTLPQLSDDDLLRLRGDTFRWMQFEEENSQEQFFDALVSYARDVVAAARRS